MGNELGFSGGILKATLGSGMESHRLMKAKFWRRRAVVEREYNNNNNNFIETRLQGTIGK